jgi:ribose-phosphate pyrophosphokinase
MGIHNARRAPDARRRAKRSRSRVVQGAAGRLGPLVLPLPGNENLAEGLARSLGAACGADPARPFPDGETYIRVTVPVRGRDVVLFCTLDRPDERTIPALLAAAALRDLGARSVGLVAPYLAYMRHDARFVPGEGITSAYFARLLSAHVDWLVTVDPHLHRYPSLDAVYAIPALALSAAPRIAAWIARHVRRPIVVGPDGESAQWVNAIATEGHFPTMVLEKTRHGDREVEISVPDAARWRGRTPVVVDDIISTAGTMVATVRLLRRVGLGSPVCIGVHAVFADGAYASLRRAGAARVVTCNTVPHRSNSIDVTDVLAAGVRAMLGSRARRRPRARAGAGSRQK